MPPGVDAQGILLDLDKASQPWLGREPPLGASSSRQSSQTLCVVGAGQGSLGDRVTAGSGDSP